jgi:hypothetical protein
MFPSERDLVPLKAVADGLETSNLLLSSSGSSENVIIMPSIRSDRRAARSRTSVAAWA